MTRKGTDTRLGDQLCSAAQRPSAFSETLHRRVMAAVHAEQPATRLAPSSVRWPWPLAAAAAVLLAAILMLHFSLPSPVASPPARVVQRIEVPTPHDLLAQAADPLRRGWEDFNAQTYAAADADARNLLEFMQRQVDISVSRPSLQ